MPQTDLLRQIKEIIAADRLLQADVAAEMGMTQPHLSRILRGKSPMTAKVETAMGRWLAKRSGDISADLDALRADLMKAPVERRMHFMRLIREIRNLL